MEGRYAIKFCVKLGKNASETFDMIKTAHGETFMSRATVFRWHKKFQEGREEVRDEERCGRERDVRTPDLVDKIRKFLDEDRRVSLLTVAAQFGVGEATVLREFTKRFRSKRPELFKSGQWHLHQDNAPTHKSIMVTSYLTEMGVKTVPHPPYSTDLAPCNFWMFPRLKEKLRGRRFEDVEEMKEAVTEALDTFTLEDYQRAFKKWLERYNKCIELGGSYFEGD